MLEQDTYQRFVKGAIERKTELLSGGSDYEKLEKIIDTLFEK